MDYYDGNTVTGLWNYAQHYALNDNSYDNQFGPSTPGAINLVSGDTENAEVVGGTSTNVNGGVMQGDAEPRYDQCSNATPAPRKRGSQSHGQRESLQLPTGVTAELTGKNVGDLLNERGSHLGLVPGRLRTDRA